MSIVDWVSDLLVFVGGYRCVCELSNDGRALYSRIGLGYIAYNSSDDGNTFPIFHDCNFRVMYLAMWA